MTMSFWTTGRDVLQAQMRHLARGLTRRHLVAVVAGMLLGGAPVLAFNLWLGFQIKAGAAGNRHCRPPRALARGDAHRHSAGRGQSDCRQ
jgi:hypothetical protein